MKMEVPYTFGSVLLMSHVLVNVETLIPAELPDIILKHFATIRHYQTYFCGFNDAKMFSKATFNSAFSRSVVLSKMAGEDIQLDDAAHRLGIFVDTHCHEGMEFVQRNKNQFNSSFKWLLWTESEYTGFGLLQTTRLDVDSDVTVVFHRKSAVNVSSPLGSDVSSTAAEDVVMLVVYRRHRSMPPESKLRQFWTSGNLHVISQDEERTNGLIEIKGSVWLASLDLNTVTNEQLADPAFALNVDAKSRYGIALLSSICRYYMNCTVQLVQAKCNDEFRRNPCNDSSGVIELVRKRHVDFGVGPFTWDNFAPDIDFSLPVMNYKHKYLFLQPKMIGSYGALLRPLAIETWILLAVLLLLGIIAFRVVSPYDSTSQHNDGWVGSAFLVLSALAQQGIPDYTEKLTTRIIQLSILLMTLIVYVYYGSVILNGLLSPPPPSVEFIKDLFDRDFRLDMEDSAYLRNRLARNEPLDAELTRQLENSQANFTNPELSIHQVAREHLAILAEEINLYRLLWETDMTYGELCSIGKVEDEQLPRQASFVLPQDSPYKELLRRGIIRARERGTMNRLKTDWFPTAPACLWKPDAVQLGLAPNTVAFIVVALGLIGGLLFLGWEKLAHSGLVRRALSIERDEDGYEKNAEVRSKTSRRSLHTNKNVN